MVQLDDALGSTVLETMKLRRSNHNQQLDLGADHANNSYANPDSYGTEYNVDETL